MNKKQMTQLGKDVTVYLNNRRTALEQQELLIKTITFYATWFGMKEGLPERIQRIEDEMNSDWGLQGSQLRPLYVKYSREAIDVTIALALAVPLGKNLSTVIFSKNG